MVRVGTLPMRLLALEYGADIVYSEEIIDKSILATQRIVNQALGTIDYVRDGNRLVYRTNELDTPNVFQIGTSDPILALKAAQKVCEDVVGIDVNMGCPKHFSIQGGMGAALLSNPSKIYDILTTLVRNLENPITCKIRLLERIEDTIHLLKVIESTGVKAVAIHARTIPQRPRHRAQWDTLKQVVEGAHLSIPVIGNGDVFSTDDIQRIKQLTGVSSVMIARGVGKDISLFGKKRVTSLYEMMKNYIRWALSTDNPFQNTKYTLWFFAKEVGSWLTCNEEAQIVQRSKSYENLCEAFGLREEYKAFQKKMKCSEINSLKHGFIPEYEEDTETQLVASKQCIIKDDVPAPTLVSNHTNSQKQYQTRNNNDNNKKENSHVADGYNCMNNDESICFLFSSLANENFQQIY
jgi:tRNA-dihydrouridine synthase 2